MNIKERQRCPKCGSNDISKRELLCHSGHKAITIWCYKCKEEVSARYAEIDYSEYKE